MSKKVCIICLVCEATTRLFCMQSAHNEDERRYENLTGIKLKCPAFLCQRCSIDLEMAITLKQKALFSAKFLTSSTNQSKVPAAKNSSNEFKAPSSNVNTTIIKSELPQNQNLTPKTAVSSLSSNMSRTDKIMNSASIISSTVVDPPIDMAKITNLFKTKPNISIIKTKITADGNKGTQEPKPKESFPKDDDDEKKVPINPNNRITKRRQTVCAENFQELQQKSKAGRNLGSFQPTIIAVPKMIVKTEFNKKSAEMKQEKAPQKRQAEEIVDKNRKKQKIDDEKGKNQPLNKYLMRQRTEKPKEREYQYWIKSKADGYYIETFSNIKEADSYLEKLPPDATYGPLSDK